MKWNLFRGIDSNRRERRLSQIGDIVIPTTSFLGGIVNIQPTTQDVNVGYREIVSALADNLPNPGSDIPRIGHMLQETDNFGVLNGKVMFRDGGSVGLENVITTKRGYEAVSSALVQITHRNNELQ